MASKRTPYLTKRVNARTGKRRIARLVAQGWEVTAQHTGWRYDPKVVLRKPNPRYVGEV